MVRGFVIGICGTDTSVRLGISFPTDTSPQRLTYMYTLRVTSFSREAVCQILLFVPCSCKG